MSWGAYWMYYKCPRCNGTFKSEIHDISNPKFGYCTKCDIKGRFVGESGKEPEGDLNVYIEQ